MVNRPETTAAVCRGTLRLLASLGWAGVLEVPLNNGRRADILALGPGGELAIVEVKSSLEDFRTDSKWLEYRDYCDRFYFAVTAEFPSGLIPESCGLIVGDRFGATIVRDSDPVPVAAARRKALTLLAARLAGERLRRLADPEGTGGPP
jgi:hypothetical protein